MANELDEYLTTPDALRQTCDADGRLDVAMDNCLAVQELQSVKDVVQHMADKSS